MGHVTGTTEYVDDVRYPGMLHLKMVRNPLVHARIRGIDFSEAEKVPGFVCALTAKDVPKNVYTILCLIGVEPDEEQVLAEERVRYRGEQIAAIVAETEEAALEAVNRVKLDLEELPAVFDVEEALKPDAPRVTHWDTNHFWYEGHHCRRVRYGDAAAARAEADHVIEGVYQNSPTEHAPTETTGCIAKPEADGRITVHTNTQALYFSLDNTAIILQIEPSRLHFMGGTVGGGFGGKVDVITEPIACLAAMKTGRPVRYVYSREEEMRVSSTRSANRIKIVDGVMDDGRIVSREVTTWHDAGAYSRHSPYGATKHAANVVRAVHDPERLDRRVLRVHEPPAGERVPRLRRDRGVVRDRDADGPDRARDRRRPVGAPAAQRLQGRRRAAAPQDRRGRDADRDDPGGGRAGRPRAAGRAEGDELGAGAGMTLLRGRGIAAVNYPTGMNLGGDPTQALVHATTVGNFVITLSSVDLGQGLKTVLAQIGAESLGVPFDTVRVDTGDTDTGPHCMGTFASRATHRAGNAIMQAAEEARRVLFEVAGEEMEVAPEDLETDGEGNVRVIGSPGLVDDGDGRRARRAFQAGPHDLRPRDLHEAQERGRAGDGRDGPGLDRGARVHGRRRRGRHRDRTRARAAPRRARTRSAAR